MQDSKVWYITGTSKGLALALVEQLLRRGQKVAATSRSLTALTKAVQDETADFLPLEVDLTDVSSVAASVKSAIDTFGRIDVVVNNAGYGTGGALEELTPEEVRHNSTVISLPS